MRNSSKHSKKSIFREWKPFEFQVFSFVGQPQVFSLVNVKVEHTIITAWPWPVVILYFNGSRLNASCMCLGSNYQLNRIPYTHTFHFRLCQHRQNEKSTKRKRDRKFLFCCIQATSELTGFGLTHSAQHFKILLSFPWKIVFVFRTIS